MLGDATGVLKNFGGLVEIAKDYETDKNKPTRFSN